MDSNLANLMSVNPWTRLDVEHPPYVLAEDAKAIASANSALETKEQFDRYGFQLQCLPDPYTGRLTAPVVVITLNPGYAAGAGPEDRNSDDWWHLNSVALREAYAKNYAQQAADYPMFFLDPESEEILVTDIGTPRSKISLTSAIARGLPTTS